MKLKKFEHRIATQEPRSNSSYWLLFLVLLFVVIGVSGCANVVAPTGGAGIKTPPFVTKSSVHNGQTNFTNKSIDITFNSYMNRSLVIENLNISPTIKYTYKWSGKTLEISFAEDLLPQTTYSITLGGSYNDYYGNVADSGFYTVFSTSDNIDSGKIQGSVYNDNKTAGYYVFCYTLDSNNSHDTNSYLTQMANYKAFVNTNGTFTIPALKDGIYRVAAVQDQDKDGIITYSRDTIGIPCYDAVIENSKAVFINIVPNGVVDTLTPEVITLQTINSNEILIVFNEPILLDLFDANCFYLTNDSGVQQTGTAYFHNKNKTTELKIYFENMIDKDTTWFVSFDSVGIGTIKDGNDNVFNLTKPIKLTNETDSVYFPLNIQDTTDTTKIANLQLIGVAKDDNMLDGVIDSATIRYLIITDIQNNRKYTTKINSDNTFKFENIEAGEYKVFYFCDINCNDKYDYGKLIPFEFAEPFVMIEKTIVLKSQWSIDNYELQIKNYKK